MSLDLIGVGSPLVDLVLQVEEEFLTEHVSGAKGGMELTREFAIHVVGSEKPAILYEMIVRYM